MNYIIVLIALTHHPLNLCMSEFACVPSVTTLQNVESFAFRFSTPKLLNNTTALVLITFYSLVTMTVLNLI